MLTQSFRTHKMSYSSKPNKERTNNTEQIKFLSHSKPGSRTEKAVKFGVRNVWCAPTNPVLLQGHLEIKSVGARSKTPIATSVRHNKDTIRATRATRACKSAKKSGKIGKTASVKNAPKMFLLTSTILTSRGPRWCFGEGQTDSMGPNEKSNLSGLCYSLSKKNSSRYLPRSYGKFQ